MDFAKAAMLTAAVLGIVTLAQVLLGVRSRRATAWTVLLASFGATFALRYSAWAHEQVIGGKPLDEMSVGSLVVVSLFLAGVETAAYLGVDAVRNIGENQADSSG